MISDNRGDTATQNIGAYRIMFHSRSWTIGYERPN